MNVHVFGVSPMFWIDTLSTINPFKAHNPPLTHGVLTYWTIVPDATPLLVNWTLYDIVWALVLTNPPAQPGLGLLVPVITELENGVTIAFGVVFAVIEFVIVGFIVADAVFHIAEVPHTTEIKTITMFPEVEWH
jgi:hypothetical protein